MRTPTLRKTICRPEGWGRRSQAVADREGGSLSRSGWRGCAELVVRAVIYCPNDCERADRQKKARDLIVCFCSN